MAITYEQYMKTRPHVVLLGAGTSCAAIPNGDRNGKKISAMNGFIQKLSLTDVLSGIRLDTASENLEDIYMEIAEKSNPGNAYDKVKDELENRIYQYMSDYVIPDSPTVYDFLLLSLTSKDLVATFNWDPLLVQSYTRVMRYTNNLPELAFLHGNVAVGFCKDDNIMGNIGKPCKCGKPLTGVRLLYPIKKKNYQSEVAISKSWKTLQNALSVAYMVTIFGYSAPKSDVEAVAMLKTAWGSIDDRKLEEIEIIDLRPEDDVLDSWSEFIHTHHYSYHTDFFDTTLGRCPRRSCEATFDRLMNCRFLDASKGFKSNMGFGDIEAFVNPLIEEERAKKLSKEMLSNPYL